MLNLLSTIVSWLQSLLGKITQEAPKKGKSAGSTPPVYVVSKLAKKAQTSLESETPPEVGKFIKSFIVDRWQWLRAHPWAVVFFTTLIGAAFFSERQTTPWWVRLATVIRAWWAQIWQDYPVSISLIGVALLFFVFGIGWLRQIDNWLLRLWQIAKSHPQIATTVGVLLLILISYVLSNANTWAFTSVEIWSENDLQFTGEELAIQFRGNLNAIGTTAFDVLTLSVPNPPAAVTNAKSTLEPLSLEDCAQIMIGPRSFVALGGRPPISLPRLSRAQADNGTAGQISLGTTLGNFNLPIERLVRFLFSYTVPNYRELSAQIVPASRSSETGAIRIIVTANDGSRWTVEGPRQNLPQLIDFLTHRIALDWKAERTGQASDQIDSASLALTLGNRAFAAGDFTAALASYRLAEWFRADSAITEVMLGLTQIKLAASAAPADARVLHDKALRAFNQAITLEPNNTDLYPYLACLYQQLGDGDQAAQRMNDFNAGLRPDTPDAAQERIAELDKKPPLGPGRPFSVIKYESGFDLYYISDDAARFALNLPYDGPFDENILSQFQSITAGQAPRQIFAVAEGAYYLTPDGLVNFFRPGNPPQITSVIDANSLQFTVTPNGEPVLGTGRADEPDQSFSNTGGIRQIFAEGELLFLADRFGRILRLRVTQTGTGGLDVIPEAVIEMDARQIFLSGNALYILKEDGTVWRISDPRTGSFQTARQLVNDTDNREITAAGGVIYMLRTNGNIWRYLDGEGTEADLLKRIDGGVETSRIFITPQGLFVLKNSGAVWLIRNPQDPNENDIEQLPIPATNRVAINVTGSTLIGLERGETTGPAIKFYQNLPQLLPSTPGQIEQAVAPSATPTPIPISTPTPAPATSTPIPTDTPTSLPTFTATPAPKARAGIITDSRTRVTDDAVEILVTTSAEQANWFWMDRTEVTNRQYQRCVAVKTCTETAGGYAGLFYESEHPVVGVSWQQAQTYCQWVGGSLPTVSQLRSAGSPDGRIYPWGDTGPSCRLAVINDACDSQEPGTRPVGSKPDGASPYGIMDLTGNVWEWSATVGNKNDTRVTLGGSWSNPDGTPLGGFEAFNPANTVSQGENLQSSNLGFRCVRAYAPASTE